MSKFWNDKIKEIEPYTPGEQPKDKKYIKLNTNENPYPPSSKVIEKIKSMNLEDLKLYPDPDVMELGKVIAEYFSNKINDKVTHKQVFIGNGSDEVLAFIFMTFFNAGDKVYYPDITYSFYPVYADLFNVKEVKIPLNDSFEIEIQKYFGLDGHIIIANPNAPTSIALKLNEIEEIVKNNPNQLVIVDEAYVDFGAESAVKLINKYDNVLVVQTFSKSRSMAGIRLGYALGSENIIEGLNRLKFSFNSYTIDRISIEAGIESFKDDKYFGKTNENNPKYLMFSYEQTPPNYFFKERNNAGREQRISFILTRKEFYHGDFYNKEGIFRYAPTLIYQELYGKDKVKQVVIDYEVKNIYYPI